MLIRPELADDLLKLLGFAGSFGFAAATILDLVSYSIWGLLGMVKKIVNAKK